MLDYKITCYDKDGNFKKDLVQIIENVIDFSEMINTGQGELILKLDEPFISTFYSKEDIVEIIVYSNSFKQGIPRYSGTIIGLRRKLVAEGEFLELKIAGIFDFLNDIKVTKTYSGDLNVVIDTIITDSGILNNITSKPTKILGSTKLKNLITNTTTTNYTTSTDEDLFSVLKKVCKLATLNFYINQKGEIVEESSIKLLIPSGRKGVEIEIDENGETEIIIENNLIKDFSPNKPIKLLNIESSYNLDGQIIQSIDYDDFTTKLSLGKVLRFGF